MEFDQAKVREEIQEQLDSNPVLLYMKGTPQFPQCGFSAQVVQALKQYDAPFAFVNILEHPEIRATIKEMQNWPTFPQLYVNGELVGGCDIIMEMHQEGELQDVLATAGSKNNA